MCIADTLLPVGLLFFWPYLRDGLAGPRYGNKANSPGDSPTDSMTERSWRCPSILPLSDTPSHATQLPIPSNRFTLPVFLSGAFLWRWNGGGGQPSRGLVKDCVAPRRPPPKDLLYFPRIPAAFLCRESLTRCDRVLRQIWEDLLEFSAPSPQHYWTTQNRIAAEKQNVCIYAGRVGGRDKLCRFMRNRMQSFMWCMYLWAHHVLANTLLQNMCD